MLNTDPADWLKRYWGYDDFRHPQRDVVESILQGHDTLALLPTGMGKSICYQVPALMYGGLTLVVSPLIALMNDQVNDLIQRGIPAGAWHSGLDRKEEDALMTALDNKRLTLLYLSPERLASRRMRDLMPTLKPKLLVVDEAHCISAWGHDFRPAYKFIARVRQWLPNIPLLALTGSATPDMVEEMLRMLDMKDAAIFRTSFDRPNLTFRVLDTNQKWESLWRVLKDQEGEQKMIYASSRRDVKEIATWLTRKGLTTEWFHAGLGVDEKKRIQQAWVDGQIKTLVCTNAFGMGINLAGVRQVIHWTAPASPESYFQEAGRAGRDGKKAACLILFEPGDGKLLQRQLEARFPPTEVIQRLYEALCNFSQIALGEGAGLALEFDPMVFCQNFAFTPATLSAGLLLLEQCGILLLNDYFHQPARVRVEASTEEIMAGDKQQLSQQVLEALIRAIPGVADHLVTLDSFRLAAQIGIDRATLEVQLQRLAKSGRITYHPTSYMPRLTWIKPRGTGRNSPVDTALLRFLKERAAEKLKAMMRYIETNKTCRTNVLLDYFGEDSHAACGHCDVCLQLAIRERPAIEDPELMVRNLLKSGPASIDQIQALNPQMTRDAWIEWLYRMEDEGVVSMRSDRTFVLSLS